MNSNKSISLYNKNSFYQRFMLNNRQAKTGTGFDNFGPVGSLGTVNENRNTANIFNNDPYSSQIPQSSGYPGGGGYGVEMNRQGLNS